MSFKNYHRHHGLKFCVFDPSKYSGETMIEGLDPLKDFDVHFDEVPTQMLFGRGKNGCFC